MVSTTIKLVIIMLMMNIILYAGTNFAESIDGNTLPRQGSIFRLDGDLIDLMFGDSIDTIMESARDNFTDYSVNVTTQFGTFFEAQGGEETGAGGISFLDALKIPYAFFKTLWNVAMTPIAMFTHYRLPVFFLLLIGVPMLIIEVIAIALLIRGVGD